MLFTDKTLLFSIQYDGIVVCSISAFRQGNIHNKPAELGYYIAGGNCIATQAIKLLCKYVFANPLENNVASCRCLEKAGFQFEETLRKSAVKCGKIRDVKIYSIIRK